MRNVPMLGHGVISHATVAAAGAATGAQNFSRPVHHTHASGMSKACSPSALGDGATNTRRTSVSHSVPLADHLCCSREHHPPNLTSLTSRWGNGVVLGKAMEYCTGLLQAAMPAHCVNTHLPSAVRRPSMAISTPCRARAMVSPGNGAGARPSSELTSAGFAAMTGDGDLWHSSVAAAVL